MDKVCDNSMFGAEIFLGEFEVFRGKVSAEVLNFEEFKVKGEGIAVVIFSMEIVRSLPPLSIIVPKKKLHIPRVRNHTLRVYGENTVDSMAVPKCAKEEGGVHMFL